MNYFELHIGDYDSATAHLSALEDGIYGRLLRLYYRTESPLPADVRQVARLVRAAAKPEREIVQALLGEFFNLHDDGWHNARCDEEIAAYQAGEPEREVKKANEDNRMRKHREERARLFQVITDAGEHLAWNAPMADLRAAVKRISGKPATAPETEPPPLPATAPATPATATQYPLPTTHKPETKRAPGSANVSRAHVEPNPEDSSPAAYGQAARAMRERGMADAHPGDPRLRALVDAGVTRDELEAAALEALGKRKGFAWALTALTNRRAELAAHPIAAAPVEDWRESRSGMDARAQALGLPTWAEFEYEQLGRGTAPRFDTWRAHLLDADRAAQATQGATT